jgi:hypothetical protein
MIHPLPDARPQKRFPQTTDLSAASGAALDCANQLGNRRGAETTEETQAARIVGEGRPFTLQVKEIPSLSASICVNLRFNCVF